MRVNLLRPLLPNVFIESVCASSDFKNRTSAISTKDAKSKAVTDGKGKTDHVKTERERIMKRESEAMKIQETFDLAVGQLETLSHQEIPQSKSKKMPSFWCEDAKRWISRNVRHL